MTITIGKNTPEKYVDTLIHLNTPCPLARILLPAHKSVLVPFICVV